MMKHFRLALVVFASVLNFARAEDQENHAPPTEIPDFSNLDEYIYEPKSTLNLSMRRLSGAKTTFSGTGSIPTANAPGPATGTGFQRTYTDGAVNPDTRIASRVNSDGNPATDPTAGGQISDPIAPDGKTNSWAYTADTQAVPGGLVAFHSYTADVTDPTIRTRTANSANGVEVSVSRDMGKLFGTRASWSLLAGVSMNDIAATTSDHVQATITTLTDLYSLDGQALPAAPYTAPSTTTTTLVDGNGNPLLDSSGSTQSTTADNSVLLSSQPVARDVKTAIDTASVSARWKVRGSYLTLRGGPVVSIPIFSRLHASFSAGPALVYAGSDYTVTQSFQPEIGSELTTTDTSAAKHFLTGYFADASLQLDLTDRAGFFAGAVFQSSGSYSQSVNSDTGHYVTKIDLSSQQGLRAGMTVKF